MGKSNSKGSIDILALAMKRVFKEVVEEGVVPLGERMGGLNKRVDTTDKNVRTDKKQD